MALEIVTVACLSDNYAFLAHDAATGTTAVVDVPEAKPILEALAARGWTASKVFLTHHHADHVQGLQEVLAQHPATVTGATADAHRLPPLDTAVQEGDTVSIGHHRGQVIDVSGHTVGHIAFHFPESAVLFTGDSLMALGCGRVFEGTKPQMWASLQKLSALPPETMVCSGHEYTAANAQFAVTVDPDNQSLRSRVEDITKARTLGHYTVPSTLALELETNPFLRPEDPSIQAHLGMTGASASDVFTEIRTRKDNF
ncbi:MAG: hydroxyacylglutathione hydrolase [Pseudomonadota bacterium]